MLKGHSTPLLALGVALLWLVYWPGLGGGWVFDDFSNIVDNESLRVDWDSGWQHWREAALSSASRDLPRPLAMTSFALDHAIHGFDPFWMKFANVSIHVANFLLVFGLVRALLRMPALAQASAARRDGVALWTAFAWALNPIHLMAVLFVVQRMESLCHTFVFAGLWLYAVGRLRVHETGRGWSTMILGLVSGAGAGTLVKESAALLPIYALLVEWALLRTSGAARIGERRRLQWFFGIFVLLPATFAAVRLLPRALDPAAYAGRDFTLVERLLTEARVLVDYLHWMLVPDLARMSLYHDAYPISRALWAPPSTAIAFALLAILAAIALLSCSRRPLLALGIAWFFAAHALTATIWPLELVFEHRNYFASLGIALALVDILLLMPRTPSAGRIGWIVAILLLLGHALATAVRAREWSDQLGFSRIEATKHPESPRASYDYARNLVILSDFHADSPYFAPAVDALERAMRVPGATPLPESAAILLAARAGVPARPEWWLGLRQKLRSRKIGLSEAGALTTLSDCVIEGYCELSRRDIVATFLSALEQGPNARVLHAYGVYAFKVLGEEAFAVTLLTDAVRLAPREIVHRLVLARMLVAMGRNDAAEPHLRAIDELDRFGRYRDETSGLRAPRSVGPSGTPKTPSAPSSPPSAGRDRT